MDNKNLIIKGLKEAPMDLDLLMKYTNLNSEELLPLIEELINEGKIRKTKKNGIYKINKGRTAFTLDEINPDDVLKYIAEGFTDIYSLMAKTNLTRAKMKNMLGDLVNEGKIRHIKEYYSDYYTMPKEARISVTDSGRIKAFVEGMDRPYNIEGGNSAVFDSDYVTILPLDKYDNTAIIDSVIERGHTFVVGIFKSKKSKKTGIVKNYIESSIPRFNVTVDVLDDTNVLPDMIVTAELEYLNNGKILGHNLKVVGHKDDPGIKIAEIALEFGFSLKFSDDVMKEVASIPQEVSEAELRGRRDFRNLNIITIDGDDSKDFDDAIYLEELPNGNYSLGVYIADVSHYVKEGSKLDIEALKRGTSLYLADRVIPMLPHELSNGICSLNPESDRLVLACIMEYSKQGKLINYEICEGVINSHHRMTYNNVNKILNGDEELLNEYSDIVPMLNKMVEFSLVLRALRHKKGGIEFDTVEY